MGRWGANHAGNVTVRSQVSAPGMIPRHYCSRIGGFRSWVWRPEGFAALPEEAKGSVHVNERFDPGGEPGALPGCVEHVIDLEFLEWRKWCAKGGQVWRAGAFGGRPAAGADVDGSCGVDQNTPFQRVNPSEIGSGAAFEIGERSGVLAREFCCLAGGE